MFLCTASVALHSYFWPSIARERERERSERGDRGKGVCAVCSQYGRLVATFVCHFYCYAKGFPKHFKSKNPTFYDRTLGNWTVLTLQWTISPRRAVKSDNTHTHTEHTANCLNWKWKLKLKTGNACTLPLSASKSIWPVEHCSQKSVRNPEI